MEEKIIEQPQIDNSNNDVLEDVSNSSYVSETIAKEVLENQEGSIFGKFKDAKNLLEAYNNLQSEFTRKCQKLAEYEKNAQKENDEKNDCKEYKDIDDFVNSNMGMDKYKKEIAEIISEEELSNLPNKYQVAYIIAKKLESESANLLNNPEFLDKNIINNPLVKDKIISNYLSNLNNVSAPSIISGNATSVYFSPTKSKPKSIKEAGELFSKMLK